MNSRAIKSKIKGVKNTKKITKAMEMIAAAKMRKAIQEASNARRYTQLATSIVVELANQPDITHPIFKTGNYGKELIVIIAANRGLCGSYNTNVAIALKKYMQERISQDADIEFMAVAINKKAGQIAKRLGLEMLEFYQDFPEKYDLNDVLPITESISRKFLNEGYARVSVAYTRFISSLHQESEVATILPFSEGTFLPQNISEESDSQQEDYKLEPNLNQVLNFALSRILEIQVFQALLESSASEHSSRMVAMKNASDNAGEMVSSLTLEYNKSRQAVITQEIAEISNAAAAIRG